ncbi:MAG: 16S rRNA (cytosine(967)-C(5))-methyltransferase RsmB [Vibrionaceae bacterium]
MNIRAVAAEVIFSVVDKGESLSSALPAGQKKIALRDGALLQEICYGVLRWLPRLEAIVAQLMDKPLTGKQRVAHHLLLVGIYQLSFMRIPAHAAVTETVDAVTTLKTPQLRALIHAVLRSYQRQSEQLEQNALSKDAGKYCHPGWLLKALQNTYPDQWQAIVEANHQRAPMWLRVNRAHHSAASYQQLLAEHDIESLPHPTAPDALQLLRPTDVAKLPGFADGFCSVQDAAAQLAVEYLAPQANELILDCCAAPGGKTCHILEREPQAKVVAVDIEPSRILRIHDNLNRLSLQAEVICGDASNPDNWWQGAMFDKILLDAPCSATGVIRRHPDIKWLRKAPDIEQLAILQGQILSNLWEKLKSGGTLVYATCSIMAQENQQQITDFLNKNKNAILQTGTLDSPGRQILPGEQNMDGFYYAVLCKA